MDLQLINKDLAPTSISERTWSKWHIASLWIGMSICIPTYTLASSMVEHGWSWRASVASITLGNLIVLIPMLLNAHAGTRYGIPFPVLLRSSFGVFGANIPALMRAFVACGWFGIQTWIGGSAIYNILISLLGNNIISHKTLPFLEINPFELLCFLSFWILQIIIIIHGINSIKILESLAAPFLIAMGGILFIWAWRSVGSLNTIISDSTPPTRSFSSALLGAGLTSGVAFWGTLALNIPDFARYAKSQKDQILGQSIGLVPTMTAFAFVGAIVTNATVFIFGSRISDPIIILSKINNPIVAILAMIAIIIATLTTNLAANIVSPANDFSNINPQKISFKKGALIASIIGVIIMPWKLYNNSSYYLFTWLMGYGSMLGSIAGIMISDYFLIKKCKLCIKDLYLKKGSYSYIFGFNPIAILALIIGILPNIPGFLNALEFINTNIFFKFIYQRAWFVSFFLSGMCYFIFTNLFKKFAKTK